MHLNVCFFSFVADIISTVEFNHTGELLATGDKGGRVVIFQQEIEVQQSLSPVLHISEKVTPWTQLLSLKEIDYCLLETIL